MSKLFKLFSIRPTRATLRREITQYVNSEYRNGDKEAIIDRLMMEACK
jgi:hypothetical protein